MKVKMYIINNSSIFSSIVKLFTFSRWSHVVISFDENTYIDSIFIDGVRLYNKKFFLDNYKKYQEISVLLSEYETAREFALNQVSKKYDWKAIIGYIFYRRKWQDESKWFCSELAATILERGGRKIFRADLSRITPYQLWSLEY